MYQNLLQFSAKCGKMFTVPKEEQIRMLFEERIELMRKAKIAAIIFGGVSTCLCGGILGVYSTSSVVSSVSPKNDVQNIYNVESEKLANVAAVTSIRTTAVTTTSTESTTTSVSSASIQEQQKDIKVMNLSFSPEICSDTIDATITTTTIDTTTSETVAVDTTAVEVADESQDINESQKYDEFSAGFTISGPFIANEEPDVNSEEINETPADEYAEVNEYTDSESNEDDFDFEPSTEYYPPAVEYIAPVQENIDFSDNTDDAEATETTEITEYIESTATTTTIAEITTTETTETTAVTDDVYAVTEILTESSVETVETTTTTSETVESTETETTTASTEAETSEATETSTTITAYVITVNYNISEDDTTTTVSDESASSLPITEQEYILLCNAVANEAGSNWISTYDKGKVVEVIMNRVNSSLYPNSVFDVISQPYQFEGSGNYVYLTTYSSYVTDDVKAAVDLYFNEPSSFTHNYFGFYGDGYQNYFY